jgi:hypothetical protein
MKHQDFRNVAVGEAFEAIEGCVLPSLTLLIHELAHFSVPAVFGLAAELHPLAVTGGARMGEAPGWLAALQAGAGPIASILMGVSAAYLFGRDRRRLWALAAAVAAAIRFLVTTVYLGLRLYFFIAGLRYGGSPNFDEHNAAVALELPNAVFAIPASLFLAALLFWLFRRVERGRRLLYFAALAIGVGAGMILWATLAPVPLLTTGAR